MTRAYARNINDPRFKTFCPRGHDKTAPGVLTPGARCRLCDVERKRERRQEARLALLPRGPRPTHRRLADGGIGGVAEQRAIDRMMQRRQLRRAA